MTVNYCDACRKTTMVVDNATFIIRKTNLSYDLCDECLNKMRDICRNHSWEIPSNAAGCGQLE